jgi:DNA-binding IscR family transcriptional regulator
MDMKFSSRFTAAVYSLLIIGDYPKTTDRKITSDVIAGLIGNNPVTIRKILVELKKAGFIHIPPGKGEGGTTLVKPLNGITLLDVLDAVEPDIPDRVFKSSKELARNSQSGVYSGEIMRKFIARGINALRAEFKTITLAGYLDELHEKEAQSPCKNPRGLFTAE